MIGRLVAVPILSGRLVKSDKMKEIKVSIIIVSYNTRELLGDCITSAVSAGEPTTETEIIVIDNASSDVSAQMVREKFPRVKLIVNKENLGFARAVNQGLRESRGKYKLLLNSDTTLLENAIKTMIEFLEHNPSAGAIRPKILSPDGKLQRQGSGFWRFLKSPDTPHRLKWVSGCCMMVRDEVIKEIGLFDENFFFYNEDVDYSCRMKERGWKLYYLPGATAIHLWGASSKAIDKLLIEQYRGKYYYYQKHYGNFILFLYKIMTLFKLIARTGLSFFSYNGKIRCETSAYSKILKITFIFLFFCFANLLTGYAGIRVGEKLTYNVKIGIFSAGTQVVQVAEKTYIDSQPVYHIISHTKTNPFFSTFYKMDNRIEAFIDERSLSLRKLIKNLNEGNFHQKSIAALDLEKGKGQVMKDNSIQSFDIPSFVLDVVSMPYYLRNIDLSLNQKILLNILADNGVKIYEPRVEAKEVVSVRKGKFDTFRIVEYKEKIKVWISADSQRLPVKISVGTNFGEIVGFLEKIE